MVYQTLKLECCWAGFVERCDDQRWTLKSMKQNWLPRKKKLLQTTKRMSERNNTGGREKLYENSADRTEKTRRNWRRLIPYQGVPITRNNILILNSVSLKLLTQNEEYLKHFLTTYL